MSRRSGLFGNLRIIHSLNPPLDALNSIVEGTPSRFVFKVFALPKLKILSLIYVKQYSIFGRAHTFRDGCVVVLEGWMYFVIRKCVAVCCSVSCSVFCRVRLLRCSVLQWCCSVLQRCCLFGRAVVFRDSQVRCGVLQCVLQCVAVAVQCVAVA